MARSFSGSGQYLTRGSAVATVTPLSMACWFNPTVATGSVVMSVSATAPPPSFDIEFHSGATNTVDAEAWSATVDDESALCATVLAVGTWYHLCAVFTSSTSRTMYVNGTGAVTSVVSVTPLNTGIVNSAIGAKPSGVSPLNGVVAFTSYWSVALGSADALSLSKGFSPKKVRPDALLSYLRLTGGLSPEPDVRSSLTWALTGTPTAVANPRLYAP